MQIEVSAEMARILLSCSRQSLVARVNQARAEGDALWARGQKEAAARSHDEARHLSAFVVLLERCAREG